MTRNELEARQKFESALVIEAGALNSGMVPQWAREADARRIAALLMRHGKTYSRIQEMNCNGVEWMQFDTNESFNKRQARHEAYCEKREGQLERRIGELVKMLGNSSDAFGVVFSGDPRGCTVKITVPSGATNDMGREGLCIPTA